MDKNYDYSQNKINGGDFCLADSATTHSILRDRKYFSNLVLAKVKVTTISGQSDVIEGSGKAQIMLPNGTILSIKNALYATRSIRNLLSFKDIRLNGYHIKTKSVENVEYLCITSNDIQKRILEKLHGLSSGLYYTYIRTVEAYTVMNQKFIDSKVYMLWHDRLGHLGSTMMCRIITNSNGHPLLSRHIDVSNDNPCKVCSQGKLVIRPSQLKIIKLRAHFPNHPIKSIRLDNAGEFTSQTYDDYCLALGIDIEHPVPYVYTQNGLAEAFIKRLQLIARTLLMKTKLPVSAWGHAILHAASLVRLRPIANHQYSSIQLVFGQQPNISHLRVFGCAVYVPIAPPQQTKMGP
ncbi:hypothetical protein ACFX19_028018 [Malus domestica]